MRRIAFWFSNLMIVAGAGLLLVTGGFYLYSQYEQARAEQEAAAMQPAVPNAWTPIAAPAVIATPTEIATSTAVPTALVTNPSATSLPATALPLPTATALPTATPVPALPVERIVAQAIKLDSKVVESPLVNGQWLVPKFVAGHLQGTAQPLQGSNIVLSGHVQSISSGNVFARIDELKPGDLIRLYTNDTVVSYTVTKVASVPNDDLAVVQPTAKEQVTLITCTGEWLPLQHDYSERTVVVAEKSS
jgi:LPXTG-site transpeptidase (sortase) family protein